MLSRTALSCALLLLAPALVVACTDPEPAAPAAGPGAGGTGGTGGSEECPDLSLTGDCRFAGPGSCPDGELCTIAPSRDCGEARCCTLPLRCRAPAGDVPGGYLCEQDDDCASGVCLSVGGVGSCLRPCELRAGGSSCPEGLACVLFSLSPEESVRACAGEEESVLQGERTLCRADRDCVDGRYCRIVGGVRLRDGGAHGLCVPGARNGEAARACQEEELGPPLTDEEGPALLSDLCAEGGFCHSACVGADPEVCNCATDDPRGACRTARCMPACAIDADCPSPFICRPINDNEVLAPDPELAFKACSFPVPLSTGWGCFDESDCCKQGLQRGGSVCCVTPTDLLCSEPPPETTHCRLEASGARYATACHVPSGLVDLGGACTAGSDCESGICGPGGGCVSPCFAGYGERCEEVLPGSRCCPTPVGELCAQACRFDCEATPACGG